MFDLNNDHFQLVFIFLFLVINNHIYKSILDSVVLYIVSFIFINQRLHLVVIITVMKQESRFLG